MVETRDELLRAALGELDHLPERKRFQYFIDALRMTVLDQAPLYMGDHRGWHYRFADVVELPYDRPEEVAARETNYVLGAGNAAAPRVERGRAA